MTTHSITPWRNAERARIILNVRLSFVLHTFPTQFDTYTYKLYSWKKKELLWWFSHAQFPRHFNCHISFPPFSFQIWKKRRENLTRLYNCAVVIIIIMALFYIISYAWAHLWKFLINSNFLILLLKIELNILEKCRIKLFLKNSNFNEFK